MPEGDTIHHAARRVGAVLQGRVPDELTLPHPRFADGRIAARLAGRRVDLVEARGKHLLIHFEDGLALHSHLRMTGSWRVMPSGAARSRRSAWLLAHVADRCAAQFKGPILELMTETRLRNDLRITALGPDIVAEEEFDVAEFLRRLRRQDPGLPIAEALLDQRTVAGIGNLWKSEGCFDAGIDPWRPTASVSDEEAAAIVMATRPRMQKSARHGFQARDNRVYERAGRPCRRCGTAVAQRRQGDDNRSTFWCPECQR